jgi:hypothetical protein
VSQSKNLCAACGNEISSSFAFITGGALFMIDANNSELKNEMEGFLDFGYHGSEAEESANLHIVEASKFGQFEIALCSTKCLRSFLNGKVDELEQKL